MATTYKDEQIRLALLRLAEATREAAGAGTEVDPTIESAALVAGASRTQVDVVSRMAATDDPLVRIEGGFWTLDCLAGGPVNHNGAPSWWTSIHTVRALERRGILEARGDQPLWRRPRYLKGPA